MAERDALHARLTELRDKFDAKAKASMSHCGCTTFGQQPEVCRSCEDLMELRDWLAEDFAVLLAALQPREEPTMTTNDIPRRARMEEWTPAEKAIYDAMQAVEVMPADVRLTKAVTLLGEAQNAVADFVDGAEDRSRQGPTPAHNEWVFVHQYGEWRCHCGYISTSWDRFAAHFNAPPRADTPPAPQTTARESLLPCPFCGRRDLLHVERDERQGVFVKCWACGAACGAKDIPETAAADLWNRRDSTAQEPPR